MSIIKLINEKYSTYFNLEENNLHYLLSESSLRNLRNFDNEVTNYFENYSFNLDTLDKYIDYLFLNYMNEYRNCVDDIPKKYHEMVICYIKNVTDTISKYNVKEVISFIRQNYELVFKSDIDLISHGMRRMTIRIICKYHSGFSDSSIYEFLINEKTILLFDNLDLIAKCIKSLDFELYSSLFIEEANFRKLCEFRYTDLLDSVVKIYRNKDIDLSIKIADKIYEFCFEERSEKDTHIYQVQRYFREAIESFKLIKHRNAADLARELKLIDDEIGDYLQENGQLFEYELSSETYSKWMDKLEEKNVAPYLKFMLVSHTLEDAEGLWESRIDDCIKDYKPSIVDFVSTTYATNEYFTYGKIQQMDISISSFSMSIFYWIKESRVNELFEYLLVNTEAIYDEIEFDYDDKALKAEINNMKAIIIDATSSKKVLRHRVYLGVFYIISFVEKLLRTVYCQIHEEGFFLEDKLTFTKILSINSNDKLIEKCLGYHHTKWLSYYWGNINGGIGHDLRNRIAHNHRVSIEEFNELELVRALWLMVSTVNSLIVNLVNNEIHNEDYETKLNIV